MEVIYLSANASNLGEVMDLSVIQQRIIPGKVIWLDKAAKDSAYRLQCVAELKGKLGIVAGGGSLTSYFAPFWNALPSDQSILFVGTGICCPHGTSEALHPRFTLHENSRFRGPLSPPGFKSANLIPPPGILYQIERVAPTHVLSVAHPGLVDEMAQHKFARKVADRIGLPLVKITNKTSEEWAYSGAALVIASRLHGIVMAAGNEIPCYSISRDHKIDWFCNVAAIPYVNPRSKSLSELGSADVKNAIESRPVELDFLKDRVRSYLDLLNVPAAVASH